MLPACRDGRTDTYISQMARRTRGCHVYICITTQCIRLSPGAYVSKVKGTSRCGGGGGGGGRSYDP